MAHFPKPFFRKDRGLWYVQLSGRQHNLGSEKEAAFIAYHKLMGQPRAVVVKNPNSLALLMDHFLEWVEKHRAAETYEWYQSRLQEFAKKYPDLLFSELKPFHIQQWIDGYKLSNGSKRNFARSIMRCMNWCEEQGLIEKNPIRHFKKPRQGKREQVISPEEYEKILAAVKRQPFKDLCMFAWETGARASECLALEKRHYEKANERVVFPVEEEKMERAPRIIYLTDKAVEIVERLSKLNPQGPIFRNVGGLPWTTDAVNCGFQRIEKKLGVKYCLTAFRHSFCHRLLRSGVDALTVSMLMGHSGTSMVASVYSHLAHAPDYLRDTIKKAASVPPTVRA